MRLLLSVPVEPPGSSLSGLRRGYHLILEVEEGRMCWELQQAWPGQPLGKDGRRPRGAQTDWFGEELSSYCPSHLPSPGKPSGQAGSRVPSCL